MFHKIDLLLIGTSRITVLEVEACNLPQSKQQKIMQKVLDVCFPNKHCSAKCIILTNLTENLDIISRFRWCHPTEITWEFTKEF